MIDKIPQDAAKNAWAYRLAPDKFHPYIALMRFDRPVGIWLLFWPCVWGVGLADGDQKLLHIVLFFIGACAMRAAGCVWNDILDRKIDAQVERTKNRPLANGTLNVQQAIMCMGALCAIGLLVLINFNTYTILLALSSLVLVSLYPLAKRFTKYPQIVLGFTFNWGVLLGFAAVHHSISFATILLYICGVLWTFGYDTIYAMQDQKDDAIVGIGSTALAFQGNIVQWVLGVYCAACVCAFCIFLLIDASNFAFVFLLCFAVHLGWQVAQLQKFGADISLTLFKSNVIAGGILALATLFS